jgi:drug/metabolite transporter (DMT)-like permease
MWRLRFLAQAQTARNRKRRRRARGYNDPVRDRLLTILSFAAIHIVWGTTYLAIHYAVQTIPPLLTAGLRHLLGGGALFAVCWSRGLRPTAVQWRASVVTGILFFLIGHGSLHWAELYVASGTAALFVATEPVWVALLSARETRLSRAAIAGLAIGIAGVAILVGVPRAHGTLEFLGSIVIVLGAMSWSLGIFYSRSAPLHPSTLMSASMSLLCGGAMLIVASALTGSLARFDVARVSAASAAGLAYLVVLGSLTFAGYTWLLGRCSPVLVATHTYTNPLIAVLLGAAIAGERLTPRMAVAGAAILLAIALVKNVKKEEKHVVPVRFRFHHRQLEREAPEAEAAPRRLR